MLRQVAIAVEPGLSTVDAGFEQSARRQSAHEYLSQGYADDYMRLAGRLGGGVGSASRPPGRRYADDLLRQVAIAMEPCLSTVDAGFEQSTQ